MPVGYMQLEFIGKEDLYLTVKPQMTYFKMVYRRYTNFAMESITVDFDGPRNCLQLFEDKEKTLRVTIPRHGDLINQTYLLVHIPEEIKSILSF